jgi:hypothetical protein
LNADRHHGSRAGGWTGVRKHKEKIVTNRNLGNVLKPLSAKIAGLGNSIVTVFSPSSANPVMKIDVREGAFGYNPAHKLLFEAKLCTALTTEGSIVVRTFLSETFTDSQGRVLPRKQIRGAGVGHERVEGMPAEAMRLAHNTDARTGKALPSEEGVEFVDW